MSTLGERLRLAREKVGLKQTQVKERSNINNKTLSGYENDVSEPDTNTLVTLAELYGVSFKWLLTGTGEMTEKESKNEEDFLAFANDPELQVFYKELPESDEESVRRLRDIWEIIKHEKK